MPKEIVRTFFSSRPQKKASKGEILIHAHEEPAGIIYLEEGRVAQFDYSPAGNKLIINIFKPGAFFPMNWAINHSTNNYFYEAMDDIKYRIAPPAGVKAFLDENPKVVMDLLSRLYKGVDGVVKRMVYLMGSDAQARLVYELAVEARRFGEYQNGYYKIKVSETDLAARAGLARETVSREVNRLKNQGLLKISGGEVKISQELLAGHD